MNIPLAIARAQGHHGTKGGRPRLDLTPAEREERRRSQKRASRLKRQREAEPSQPAPTPPPDESVEQAFPELYGQSWDDPPGTKTIHTEGRHSPLRGDRHTKPKRRKKAKSRRR